MARKRRRNILQDKYRVRGQLHRQLVADQSCAYCPSDATTVDHVVPVSVYVRVLGDDGRVSAVNNLIPACRPCNTTRGNMPIEQFAKDGLHEVIQRFPRIAPGLARIKAATYA